MLGVARFSVNKRISRDGSLMVGGRTYQTTMQKFYFATETIVILPQTLSQPRYGRSALANITSQMGYFGQGYATDFLSSITKINLQTNTEMSFSGTFPTLGRTSPSRASNNGVAGYTAGGYYGGYLASIDKFSFTSESASSMSTTLSQARAHVASINNNAVAMYSAGGETYGNPYTTPYSNIDKMPYSNETRSTFYLPLAVTEAQNGFSNSGTAGYVAGGFYQTSPTSMQGIGNYWKWPFSTDTISTTTSNLYFNGSYPNQFSNYAVAGYIVGSMNYDTIKKISFVNDTISDIGAMPQRDDFVGPLTSSIGN
jgi:hypothetical protein